ncbi:MAG: TIM barrel protein [Planctomycetota bacterium]
MKRRQFLTSTAAATVAATSASTLSDVTGTGKTTSNSNRFKLHYAPHFGMFKNLAGDDPIDQIKFAADQGFTAWEDNGMKGRSPEMQKKIGKTLAELDMRMGVFVAHASANKPTFAVKNEDVWESVLSDMRQSIEVAKRVNAKWMTVVPGKADERGGRRLEMGYQAANVIELLRRCCEVFEKDELVMVLEPLNWYANHGGVFLQGSPQAYEICKAVNHPSCKILFDIYHQQISEGNLIPNIDLCWDEIGYFQCGDNPGRKEPGTGEINYRNVFGHLHSKGFKGIMGMEHGNSKSGKDGDQAVIDAYRVADNF